MKCKTCGKDHHESYHVKDRIKDKGYPTNQGRKYQSAHEAANKAEKDRFPKGFKELKNIDISLGKKHELAGKNTKSGKIEVSKKVPAKLRPEVAMNEKTESKILKRKK